MTPAIMRYSERRMTWINFEAGLCKGMAGEVHQSLWQSLLDIMVLVYDFFHSNRLETSA